MQGKAGRCLGSIVSPHFLHRNPTEAAQTAAIVISAGVPAAVQMKSRKTHAALVAAIQTLGVHASGPRR
ncbi:hypothetical protein ACFVUR_10630 [Stenotrophomonas bentonitica]|uniref:hypothetical protein n=1 Tax=Stenotrophomonas bentonitica TaxID=1450134 RepID=UPI0036E248BF